MKFAIYRTSRSDTQPHERAFKDKYTKVDVRNVDNPSKSPFKYDRVNWFLEGTNHRVEDGKIKRDFEAEAWFINIESLDDLILFRNELDEEIIINKYWNGGDYPSIEIYDDYR